MSTDKAPVVLSIAGSDNSAGAGIQADIKTAAALGAYCVTAVTAVTSQNHLGVHAIEAMPAALVSSQIDAAMRAYPVSVIKIGMLANANIVAAVSRCLEQNPELPVVFDPVIRATSGGGLLDEDAVQLLRDTIVPYATVFTPNLSEAAVFLAQPEALTIAALESQAIALGEFQAENVVLKGGHFNGPMAIDVLYSPLAENRLTRFQNAKIDTVHGHGTGCTLATAIAVGLVQNHRVVDAVRNANDYVHHALKYSNMWAKALGFNQSNGPLHHFYQNHCETSLCPPLTHPI